MAARYSGQAGYSVRKRTSVRRPGVQKAQSNFKFGPTTAKFLGLVVLAILGAVMVSQSSGNATTAYKQSDIRKEIGQTNQDVERLQLEAKRAQSLQEIQAGTVKDGMEQTTKTEQVEIGTVAGVSTEKAN